MDIFLRTGATPGHRNLPLVDQARLLASIFRSMATALELVHEGVAVIFMIRLGVWPVTSMNL